MVDPEIKQGKEQWKGVRSISLMIVLHDLVKVASFVTGGGGARELAEDR